ncbi:CMP-sialic acid transporter 3-like [Lactuca sativa]|uniref:CMP-sialic acid transporter 3-like n=1 Tax=Lactuca sativa TaxID=4236 RepID=UPI0022AE7DBE|nr:CMP-sialic acid transporter 3-like [Lactuca sativa]
MKRQFSIIQWETLALFVIFCVVILYPIVRLKNLFLYGYAAIFSFLGIFGTVVIKGPESFDILRGRSKATMLLIINNAGQVILSSFFFKYADTILKKYSSTVATIFTGVESATLFGHTLTINFLLGISTVFISMHQVCDSDRIGIQDAGVNMFVFFHFSLINILSTYI